MGKIRMQGWRNGAQTISAIRALTETTTLGLAESKRSIEEVLGGGVFETNVREGKSPEELVRMLRDFGFEARVVDE